MASPEGVTAQGDDVIISVYGQGRGFGIRPASPFNNSPLPNAAVGTVYKIGYNVYNVAVGNKVGFKTDCFFVTDMDETFAVVNKENIKITYISPP